MDAVQCRVTGRWLQVGIVLLALWVDSARSEQFKWHVGGWSECQHERCGTGGSQYRDVWCVHQDGRPVASDRCEEDFKPSVRKSCTKPCFENVVLHNAAETSRERPTQGHQYGPEVPDQVDWESTEVRGNRFDLSNDYGGRDESKTGGPRTPLSVATSDVEWVVSQWSSCKLESDTKSCGRNSGVRFRDVSCERKDSQVLMPDSRCLQVEPKPTTRETCELLCRQDCVVGEYRNWSECSSSCHLTNRTRTRVVVVPPRHRGSHCPELSEMAPCTNCTASVTYQYSAWLPCTSMEPVYLNDVKTHPSIGYQTREVACLQSKGVLTSDRYCQEKFPNVIPRKSRACVMAQDCKVSSWSSMSPYNSSCIGYDGVIQPGFMVRSRQVLQLPLGSGDPCPANLVEYIRLNKEDIKSLRSCKQAKWIASNWTPCQEVPGYNHCGTGVQTRHAICVEPGDDGVERPVDASHCVVQYRPSVAMSCTMECNWDCSVSQWSTWSTCQASDCDGLATSRQRRAEESIGKTFRTRVILTLPGSGGKPCPHLSETRMCEPQPCYTWNITLGSCEATTRGGCGEGTQLRKAVCLNRLGVKVRERYCHETLQAEQNWANCYVSCPEDCIVSEWGSWSSCPNPCNIPVGSRVSRTRTRHILSPQMLGRPCLFLNNLRQAEPCPVLHDCETYQWEVSTWEPCKLDQGHSQCGTGTQSRKVDCRTAKHMWADSDKCLDKIKPVSTQTCLLPCPLDCELTEWSDWSACGATCLPLQARQIYPSQIRKRFILQHPQFGGVRCPEDLVEEQSCLELPVCQSYYWETSEWSDCILAPEFPRCGLGLRARNITCKHANNQNINDVIISVCLENLGFIPDFTEQCHVPCESECQFENWSPWTQCDPPCERSRFRYRGLIGESKRLKECKDSTMEQEECVCAEQAISLGGWSDCIIETPPVHNRRSYSKDYIDRPIYSDGMKHGLLNSCGEGKQYLMLSCQNTNADIMGQMKYCEPKEQQCNVSCPVDCETTEWSSWSSCSVYCGSGIQQRERRIMKMQSNGGRKCPFMFGNDKESQTRVCTIECSYKIWKTDDWGPCFPNSSKSCGEGTHARQIRCVSVGADGSETTIDNNFCEKDEEPATIKSCSLPCPGECVMSEWMEWTPCRQPCNGQQTQKRYRSVLRWPRNYDKIRQCVQQQDERTCERQVNCIEYSWELSDWTSCLVNEGRSDCGVGHKERFAICRNEVGEKVENYRCQKLFGPVTEPLVVSCEIPCDYDCLLSDWSEWTPCSVSCGLGKTLRKRTVLQSPMGNGRKCPEKNEQSKSCFNKGCYRWHASEWSECNIEMNFCGVGVQERNVTCVGDDGRSVNTSKCEKDLANLVTQTSRPCQVPCPGECFLSEWSSWSLCFISCEDFQQGFSMGVQARSRAVLANPMPSNTPCNTTLWEDRTCEASQCTFFKWSVGEWDSVTGKRSVACERQDGLPVVGGCDESQRPSDRLLCDNPRCVSPAVCSDINVCECPGTAGSSSITQYVLYSVNSTALSCRMNVTGTGDAATGAKAEMAKSPNVWMYAVIVVGTVFVIAVTAALYNMCELFRTGPRPRRKGEYSREGSTTGTIHSVRSAHGNSSALNMSRSENLYKEINHLDAEETVTLSSDKETPSPKSNNSHHHHHLHAPLALPVSCDPEDIPDIVSPAASAPPPPPPVGSSTPAVTIMKTSASKAAPPPPLARSKVSEPPLHDDKTNSVKLNNRRYHRMHRFLPSSVAQCFACKDSDGDLTAVRAAEDGTDDLAGQTMALTYGHLKENQDSLGGYSANDANTSSSSGFQSHNCMLPRTHPRSLELARRSKVFAEFELVADPRDNVCAPTQNATTPRTQHARVPHAGTREDLRLVTGTSCGSSSESIAMSSDLISGKQEESSQCSLQLGDTAETVRQGAMGDIPVCCQSAKPSIETPTSHQVATHQQRPSNLNPRSKLVYLSKRAVPIADPLAQSPVAEPCAAPNGKSGTRARAERSPSGGSSIDELCYTAVERPVHLIPSLEDLAYSQNTARSYRPYHRKGDKFLSTSASALLPAEVHQPRPRQNILSFRSTTKAAKASPPHADALQTMSTSPSFASLPENAVHSSTAQRSRKSLPLLEKASQDSGHASIPRSRTVSPGEFSLDSSDVIVRTGSSACIKGGYSPLHIQTSMESGHDSPTASIYNSYRKDMGSPGVGVYLMCSPDSPSQHSSISGMETSV